jgi:hypothetical protein
MQVLDHYWFVSMATTTPTEWFVLGSGDGTSFGTHRNSIVACDFWLSKYAKIILQPWKKEPDDDDNDNNDDAIILQDIQDALQLEAKT